MGGTIFSWTCMHAPFSAVTVTGRNLKHKHVYQGLHTAIDVLDA